MSRCLRIKSLAIHVVWSPTRPKPPCTSKYMIFLLDCFPAHKMSYPSYQKVQTIVHISRCTAPLHKNFLPMRFPCWCGQVDMLMPSNYSCELFYGPKRKCHVSCWNRLVLVLLVGVGVELLVLVLVLISRSSSYTGATHAMYSRENSPCHLSYLVCLAQMLSLIHI